LVGFESGLKQSVKFLQHNSPPNLRHTMSVYTVHLVWEGGEEVIEKIEGQQCTSIVPSSMGATVHKLGRKYQTMSECISSL
jgi:hypothetical protein